MFRAHWLFALAIVICAAVTLLTSVERVIFGGGSREARKNVPTALSRGTPSPQASGPRDQHWEASTLLNEALQQQREALSLSEQWNEQIEPLREGTNGEAITANEDLVGKIAYVFSKQRLASSDVAALGDQIAAMLDRVKQAESATPPEVLSAREMYEAKRLSKQAKSARHDWDQALREAQAIALKANQAANPTETPTLEESLQQVESDKTLEQLDRQIEEAELRPATIDSKQIAEPLFDELQTEYQQLRKHALAPEVLSTLAPFLEPRTIQPSLAGTLSIKFSQTFERQPMSLGALMAIGVLGDSELALKKLARVGGNRKLPEPKWSISSQPHSWSEDDQAFLRSAQQMLRDYGSILVEEGLLSP